MKSNNKFSLLALVLILFCMVVALASCHDTEMTAPESKTTSDVTATPISTTPAITTTALISTEDELSWLKKVMPSLPELGPDGGEGKDPNYYFSEEFKKTVTTDQNGALVLLIKLQEEYATVADYEAVMDKYNIDGEIGVFWDRPYYFIVGVKTVDELKEYASIPEVWIIDFDLIPIPA